MMTSALICPSPFFGISPLVLFMFHPLNNYEESQIVTTLSSLGSNRLCRGHGSTHFYFHRPSTIM